MPPTLLALLLVLLKASAVVSVGSVSWGGDKIWADLCPPWLGDLGADLQV